MRCSASSAIARRKSSAPGAHTSGLSTLIKDHLAGAASRLAALLLPQILPVFLVVTPCQPGAALRDLVLVQRGQATSELIAVIFNPRGAFDLQAAGQYIRHLRGAEWAAICVFVCATLARVSVGILSA